MRFYIGFIPIQPVIEPKPAFKHVANSLPTRANALWFKL